MVDDAENVRLALQDCLCLLGYEASTAAGGDEALELLRSQRFDLLLTDQGMPGLSGLDLTRAVTLMHPHMPVVLLTGLTDVELAKTSMQVGASDFITKPIKVRELPIVIERNLTRRQMELARLKEREAAVLLEAIKALASAVDAKDPYTARHSMRVSRLAFAMADALALADRERYILELASWMHDVGKIGVPDRILTKPAALEAAEHEIIKQHSIKGGEIVGHIEELRLVADAIRHHHERMDGRGYPDGLRGEAIPLNSRIIHVADAFEAMTSNRSYRHSLARSQALAELAKHSGTQFDGALVAHFVRLIEANPSL